MSNITDKQYKEAFDKMFKYEKEIADYNTAFVKQFGETAEKDFAEMCEDCTVTSKVEFVDKPLGSHQDEDYGIFKNVVIDQHSVGDSGDSYAGAIYANVNGKWIRVYYEC
jgi:2-methylaconitate cis-trans-isomerase PrpF